MQDKARSKSKDKAKNKGKEKEKEKGADVREGLVYDYEDGSVQDGALREDIMRGYERFKVSIFGRSLSYSLALILCSFR